MMHGLRILENTLLLISLSNLDAMLDMALNVSQPFRTYPLEALQSTPLMGADTGLPTPKLASHAISILQPLPQSSSTLRLKNL